MGIISPSEYADSQSILHRTKGFTFHSLERGTFLNNSYFYGDAGECIPLSKYDSDFLATLYGEHKFLFKTVVVLDRMRPSSLRRCEVPAFSCDDRHWLEGTYIYYTDKCNRKNYNDDNYRLAVYLGQERYLRNKENILKGIYHTPTVGKTPQIESFDNGNGFIGYAFKGKDIFKMPDKYREVDFQMFAAVNVENIVVITTWAEAAAAVNKPYYAISLVPKFAELQKQARDNAVRIKGPCEDLTGTAKSSCEEAERVRVAREVEEYRKKQAEANYEWGVPKGPAAESCSTSYVTRDGVQTATTTCRRW